MPTSVAPGGQAIVDMLPAESPAATEPRYTVIRSIMEVMMYPITQGVDSFGAFGLTTTTRDAFLAGAVPDPITDFVDWYWHKNFATFTVGGSDRVTRFNVDLHTARTIRGFGRTLAFVFDVNAAGGSNLVFSINARFLLSV